MKDFRNLKVWEKAHALVIDIYRLTKKFPAEERYGLSAQLRKASSSIGSNLAEGCGRNSDAALASFATIAMGSASEVEYQLLLARDLEYVADVAYEPARLAVVEVKKMLASLIKTLNSAR